MLSKRNLKISLIWIIMAVLLPVLTYGQAGQSGSVTSNAAGFTSSNLPIIILNTHGQVIVDEPKIIVDMGIIYNGPGKTNNITDPLNNYNGKAAIEIRGSTSQSFPKKQYSVETCDSLGNSVDVSLLGFPAENDWILFAPYNDKSLMRDVMAYRLSNDMGRYASRSQYCELVLNGQYMGVYVLFEKIKRNKNRVNVSKIGAADSTGDNLTGGYIIKVDKDEGGENAGWNSMYAPFPGAYQRVWYQYHYPDAEDMTASQMKYIQGYVREFEKVLYNHTSTDTTDIYRYFDKDAAVDFFLLNEMSRNVDAYRLSTFMHKNRDSKGGKLTMGPVWDFNLSFGNCDYYSAWITSRWGLEFQLNDGYFKSTDGFQPPFWWRVIYNDPSFFRRAAEKWQQYRSGVLSTARVNSLIDSLVVYLNEPQKRNFQRWPVLGQYVWPNKFIGQTYDEEVKYLKNWITIRMSWMDLELNKYTSVESNSSKLLPQSVMLGQNYPNPFNPSTVISYTLPSASHIRLQVFDVLGREVAVIEDSYKQAGAYSSNIDFQRLKNAGASGVYFYTLTAVSLGGETSVLTNRMIYLK